MPKERLWGDGNPHGCGPTGFGDGKSRLGGARFLWSAFGDGSSHKRGPTSWGNGETCPRGSCYVCSVCGGPEVLSVRAHQRGARGDQPKRRLRAHGALEGDCNPDGCGPTSCGDGKSCLGGGCCLWSACGAWKLPLAEAHRLGGPRDLPRSRSLPMERLRGTTPYRCGPTSWRTGSRV